MTFKRAIILGIVVSVFSILLCFIYRQIYSTALDVDFSSVLSELGITLTNIVACFLISMVYYFLSRLVKRNLIWLFNFAVVALSLVSTIGVFAFQLPLEVESPELFPGLAIPMHFFPALSFFVSLPLFLKQNIKIA